MFFICFLFVFIGSIVFFSHKRWRWRDILWRQCCGDNVVGNRLNELLEIGTISPH